MSFLADLISSKKSQLSKDKKRIGKKWIRRGEIKKLREKEQEENVKRLKREREAAKIEAETKRIKRKLESIETTSDSGAGHAGTATTSAESNASEKVTLPVHEVKRRLRLLKVPVTLFGETELMRYKRMRKIEIDGVEDDQETRLDAAFATRNVFLKNKQDQMDENENDDDEDIADPTETPRPAGEAGDKGTNASSPRTKKRDKNRPVSDETHILRFWRRMLREWQADLAARPEEVKNSAAGRNATKTQKQCKDYMRPFLKMCRAKTVQSDILEHVKIIVRDCENRQYVHAHEQYMRLAIGNAPWPIGVTSVGIHERAARERIEVSKIAHVLNDECQRKYVTSMKRLMTYCQTKYPTNPSQMVLN